MRFFALKKVGSEEARWPESIPSTLRGPAAPRGAQLHSPDQDVNQQVDRFVQAFVAHSAQLRER